LRESLVNIGHRDRAEDFIRHNGIEGLRAERSRHTYQLKNSALR